MLKCKCGRVKVSKRVNIAITCQCGSTVRSKGRFKWLIPLVLLVLFGSGCVSSIESYGFQQEVLVCSQACSSNAMTHYKSKFKTCDCKQEIKYK